MVDSGNRDRDLTDLLVLLGEAAAEKETVAALLIDELHYVKEMELGALIAGLHRVSQLNPPLVLFGAGLPQLAGMAGNARSYAALLFVFDEIGPLARSDTVAALEEPVARAGAGFTKAALDEVIRATEGYPWFLQEWGNHAWLQTEKSPIPYDDVVAAGFPAVSELDRQFFRVRFDRLTPTERDYLRAPAELGPKPQRSGDIAAILNQPVEQVAPTRARVILKGMAYAPAHGDTAFPDFSPRPPRKRK